MLLLHMQEIVCVDSQEGLLSSRGGGGGGADILAPGLHVLYVYVNFLYSHLGQDCLEEEIYFNLNGTFLEK